MDEKLRRAFQLAYFILGDEQAALRVTEEAVATLDVALAAQDKRFYYAPGSHAAQPAAARFRTKVSLSELQLLQRLVYVAAEPEERRKEAQGIPEATWLIHYLKHLARVTLKRNSFFVTLGVSRLLHNYTTPEAMRIYELIVQDPARVRDDSYYRRRKSQLMRELLDRFGERLAVQRGQRGEERFQPLQEADRYLQLVVDCLHAFTPWETTCLVPAAFDPAHDELPPLRFQGKDPDAEHPVEISRIHTLLHPDCYRRLLAALRLDPPARRLELPQFRETNGNLPPTNNNLRPPPAGINEEEMKHIKDYLAQQRERRKRFSPAWLRVAVDGAMRAQTTPAQPDQLRLAIAPDAELIEVYGATDEDELRLAAYVVGYDEEESLLPATATLVLESGQQLSFDVQPQFDTAGQCTGALVAVAYRETAPLRAALWWLRRQRQQLFGLGPGEAPGALWKPALAFTLLAAAGITLAVWFFKPVAPGNELAHNATPTPHASPSAAPTASPVRSPVAAASISPRPSASPLSLGDEVIAMDIRSRASGDPADSLIREKRAEAVGLLEARRVYLEGSGVEQLRQMVSARLTEHLESGGTFNFTANRDEADLALKVTVEALPGERLALTARIVDANGKVIWPLTPRSKGRRYEGPTEKALDRLCGDLLGDARRLKQK
jgi:hypothetical protein